VLNVPRQGPGLLSSYDPNTGTAYLYSGSFDGSRHYLSALFFHELGHSTAERYDTQSGDSSIPLAVRKQMHAAHRTLAGGKAMLGLDWAYGSKDRAKYQDSFSEFLAEMNLMYVTAGPKLRKHIESFPEGSPQREAWNFVYAEMRDRIFQGREYDYSQSAPTVVGRTTSPDSASRHWDGFNDNLQGTGFSLNRLPEGQNRLDVYVGDPKMMSADAGPAIVASAFASGETPRYWGALWQGGEGWRYYPGENQTVLASDYSVKAPEPDGGIRLAEGDVLSLGYHFFVFSKGELKLLADANQSGISPHFDLHLPKQAAARSQVSGDMGERAPRGPLMDPQILSGSVDFSKSIPIHSTPATSENGEFSRVTTQGLAYKPVNEDVVFSARGPDGKLLMLNVDGMGGHADGDAAAILVAEAFKAEYQRSGDTAKAWELANQTVLRFNGASVNQKMSRDEAMSEARKIIADPSQFGIDPIAKGSGAVAVMVEQSPVTSDGQAGRVRFEWVGDARAMLIRPDAKNRLQWVYRTVDEGLPSMPGELRPGVHYPEGGRGKTLVMQIHPDANVVTNAIGTSATLQVRGTQHGETPNSADPQGSSVVGDSYAKGLELRPNDWVILASDGFWENFGRTEAILNILDKATTADEATRLLTEEAHWRMDILGQAKAGTLPKAKSGRYVFEKPGGIYYIDGQGRWRKAQSMEIDKRGVVYEPGGKTPVDHFKNDNFSLTVYRNNPDTAALKTDVQPPIDGRSGHNQDDGTGQGLYGGSKMEMKLVGSGDGSAKDLQELKKAYSEKDAGLLKEIQSHGTVEGTARSYEAKEFPELLHLVMERGQPIEILPTAKKIRATVENEMYGFVVEVERRFPEEFKKAGKNDPDTGESFQIKGNDGKLKPNVPAMYRFAKRLLNGKLGLPVHGEASPRQKESVLGFMQGAMGRKDLDTYEKAAEVLRQDFKAYGTEFQKAYKAAKPAMRDALLDAFFDGKRYATFTSLKDASGLLRFLGKTGHHVEF
ncbi:MAG TPA: hypothetical protein VJP40_08195, partial [bacterium]|nr:hypothetical protein [bacterium]